MKFENMLPKNELSDSKLNCQFFVHTRTFHSWKVLKGKYHILKFWRNLSIWGWYLEIPRSQIGWQSRNLLIAPVHRYPRSSSYPTQTVLYRAFNILHIMNKKNFTNKVHFDILIYAVFCAELISIVVRVIHIIHHMQCSVFTIRNCVRQGQRTEETQLTLSHNRRPVHRLPIGGTWQCCGLWW